MTDQKDKIESTAKEMQNVKNDVQSADAKLQSVMIKQAFTTPSVVAIVIALMSATGLAVWYFMKRKYETQEGNDDTNVLV